MRPKYFGSLIGRPMNCQTMNSNESCMPNRMGSGTSIADHGLARQPFHDSKVHKGSDAAAASKQPATKGRMPTAHALRATAKGS